MNSLIIFIYKILSLFPNIKKKHYEIWEGSVSGFVENQNDYPHIKFGKAKLSKCGCGIVATYNLLIFKNFDVKLSDIIKRFENGGLVSNGRLGINPFFVKTVLKEYGLNSRSMIFKGSKEVPRFFSDSQAGVILTYSEGKNLFKGFHFLFVYKDENGEYVTKNPMLKIESIDNAIYGIKI